MRRCAKPVLGENLMRMLRLNLSDGVSDNSDVTNAVEAITQVTTRHRKQVSAVECDVRGEQRFDLIFRVADEVSLFELCTSLLNSLPFHLKDVEILRHYTDSETGPGSSLTEIRVELWRVEASGVVFSPIQDYGRDTSQLELDKVQSLSAEDGETIHAVARCVFNMQCNMPATEMVVELPGESSECKDRYCITFYNLESVRFNFLLQLLVSFSGFLLDAKVPLGKPRLSLWLRRHSASTAAGTYVVQTRHPSIRSAPITPLSLPPNTLTQLRKRRRAFEDVEVELPGPTKRPRTLISRLFGR